VSEAPWSLHLLAELLSVFSPDRPDVLRIAVDRIAEAVDAEVAGVLVDAGAGPVFEHVIGAVGDEVAGLCALGARRPPTAGLRAGTTHLLWLPLDDPRTLVVGRVEQPFDDEECALLRAMARSTSLGIGLTGSVRAERSARAAAERHAAQSAGLLRALRERNQLLDRLAGIQRQISVRAPLADVLELIVTGLAQSVPDGEAACYVDDGEGPAVPVAATSASLPPVEAPEHPARRAVATNAVTEGDDRTLAGNGRASIVAAPVHRDGHPVGALVLCSPTAAMNSRDVIEALTSYAEHASLALNDASARSALDDALDQAMHRATHDPLTGLPNRGRVLEQLEQMLRLRRAVGGRGRVTVFFVDVDRFKQINDLHGHAVGDRFLCEVGQRLRSAVRDQDLVGRLAGDEFVVVSAALAAERAEELADRLVRSLSSPTVVDGRVLTPSVSVGLARAGAGDDAETVLNNADLAMYRAKQRGRARYERFDRTLRDAADRRAMTEAELRRAIGGGELAVHLQPIVRLADGRITDFEALVRWEHPTRGLLLPADFVPVAEESGQIAEIDALSLRLACHEAALWPDPPEGSPLGLGVNVSARRFADPALPDDVAHVLGDTGLDPRRLHLEITESVILEELDSAYETMRRLLDLGVCIAIDDFGTGYSSLRYLKRFPVGVLKIDRSFVDGLGEDRDDEVIVEAVISMADALGIEVIGEGVETVVQANRLLELGCPRGQGFLVGRPTDPATAAHLAGGTFLALPD
jgi:diguanylate cyclase (GGDEF)-like protein